MSDWFTKAFGAALQDVRQKVLEEGFFGRTVTPRRLAELDKDQGGMPIWERLGWDRPAADQRPTPSHDLDRGIDR